jgi:hypothetical protein
MLDPRYLDLATHQVQGNMGLRNMQDTRYLDLAISQVQGNDRPPLACQWNEVMRIWRTCKIQGTWI